MSETLKKPKQAAPSTPTVVVRLARSCKKAVVTSEMKAQLRIRAKTSTRSIFPELPEWRVAR
ncbi:hypothetical protein [Paraburkholderia youngii]|uniref:hypothetical protein n=1 Tax=Paraburkholderia youngii TaxID=2782701 RepID=UPI001591637C|nr:hypothetical protein [Paraburkholderia youngii]NUX59352.1 hypothetical protein [Paraburkholderia youngii]